MVTLSDKASGAFGLVGDLFDRFEDGDALLARLPRREEAVGWPPAGLHRRSCGYLVGVITCQRARKKETMGHRYLVYVLEVDLILVRTLVLGN